MLLLDVVIVMFEMDFKLLCGVFVIVLLVV